ICRSLSGEGVAITTTSIVVLVSAHSKVTCMRTATVKKIIVALSVSGFSLTSCVGSQVAELPQTPEEGGQQQSGAADELVASSNDDFNSQSFEQGGAAVPMTFQERDFAEAALNVDELSYQFEYLTVKLADKINLQN